MTGPRPIFNPQGIVTSVPQSEWEAATQRRTELVDGILQRMKLAKQVGQENADTAVNQHQVAGQNADGSLTTYQEQLRPPDQHETNHLLAAAKYYGIENADKIPPLALKS